MMDDDVPAVFTSSNAHNVREGDMIIIDTRCCPRFMPDWFYYAVWRRWFQAEPKPMRVSEASTTTFKL